MSARWERLLDQKPVSLLDHLVQEAAKLIAQDYLCWPLEVEAEPGAPDLPPADQPRPSPTAYREALRLARWDLASELDAYDDYMRNHRYLERGLTEGDRQTLLLLSRWLLEQLLALGEHTHGRVNRKRKLDCLEAIGRALPLM